MHIGKCIKIDDQDYVFKDNCIWKVIDNISTHPYLPNQYCMFEILFIFNKSQDPNLPLKQFAKLLSWEGTHDYKTGKPII
jgi:hypothetical protein